MEFNRNKPIYIQIAGWIADKILSGEWIAESRIPSVREVAVTLQVNPNTVMRSFERLQSEGVIYNKRGVGYIVSENARQKLHEREKAVFLREILPDLYRQMELLGITIEDLNSEYVKFKDSPNEDKH